MNKIRSFSDKTDVSSSSSCESFRHSRMDDDVRRSRDFGRSCIPHNSFHSLTNDDNTTIKTSDNMNGFEKLKPESSKKLYCSSSETGVLKDVNDCNRLVEQERQYTSNTITKNLNKQNALEANESTASASSTTSENIGDCKSESSSFSVAKRKLLLNRLNNGPSFLNESGKLSKGDDRCTSVQSVSTSDNSMKDQVLPCTSTDSDVHPQLSPTIESSSLSSGALKVPKETTNSLLKEFLRRHCVKADSNSKSKGLESNNNSSSYSTGSSLTVKK